MNRCGTLIANCEGRFADARQALLSAIEKARAFSGTPLMAGHIRLIKAHLCIASARMGDIAEAQSLFAQAGRFLQKHHESQLYHDCQSALAQLR